MKKLTILVIDDELTVVQECTRALIRSGYVVDTALTQTEAITKLNEQKYDVVLLDLKMGGVSNLELMHLLREASPSSAVIIMHGMAPMIASGILGNGVYEYLSKPFTSDDLIITLNHALQHRSMLLQAMRACEIETVTDFGELVGNGPAMRALFRLIVKIAPKGSVVLVVGQEGTGKILAAEAIHRMSNRRGEPFVKTSTKTYNAAELNEKLFSKVIASHTEKGFIPGAIYDAGNGTSYIDEITALDEEGQLKLLDAIRKREYLPVNGSDYFPANCRFILGTSRDLRITMKQKPLLDELYQRVSVFPIYLPSLAERTEDIPSLAYQFMRRAAARFGKNVNRIDDRLLAQLTSRAWPGNVRELERHIERMVSICEEDILSLHHYQNVMEDGGYQIWRGKPPVDCEELKRIKKTIRHLAVAEVERAFVTDALQRNGGNVTRAAIDVKMQRRNFQALMRTHGIKSGY